MSGGVCKRAGRSFPRRAERGSRLLEEATRSACRSCGSPSERGPNDVTKHPSHPSAGPNRIRFEASFSAEEHPRAPSVPRAYLQDRSASTRAVVSSAAMPISVLPYERENDVVVIGSGPGGEGAAMKSGEGRPKRRSWSSRSTPMVGGGCTHWATIPSKALRQSVQDRPTNFRRKDPLFAGLQRPRPLRPIPQMLACGRAGDPQAGLDAGATSTCATTSRWIHGTGRFVDDHTLEVNGKADPREELHHRDRHEALSTEQHRLHPPSRLRQRHDPPARSHAGDHRDLRRGGDRLASTHRSFATSA